MLRDYTFDCLVTMPRHELEEFSARMISKMVPEDVMNELFTFDQEEVCLLYTSPSPRDRQKSRMPSSA